jgi:hypothetical protein
MAPPEITEVPKAAVAVTLLVTAGFEKNLTGG